MPKALVILFFSILLFSCQNSKKVDHSNNTFSNPTSLAPISTSTLKPEDSLWLSPLGSRLKSEYNFNPGSQGSKDQNIIIEYSLKNTLDMKRTTSGLYYLMEREGKGDSPLRTNRVITHYKGYLLDGTEFDNSYKRGEPANFSVVEVVAGWTEALLMMKPGSKIKLLIPSALGWGQTGAQGGPIGPNAVTAFDMELLSVN